ncbi:galactose oxidase early set domain-containing protein [Cryobacterium sp. Y11]|uniref:galactose oxidase early set domain-containing protein n=1 Tax=Cryobacterium sp. Y11 TaxID=2045016 RepID=UPI001E4801BF|nr:galactose oxidase early set domain-containing protein [Cryobacterium sp. Y11]
MPFRATFLARTATIFAQGVVLTFGLIPLATAPVDIRAAAEPVNLVSNPSLEQGEPWPTCFSPAGWGTEASWSLIAGPTGGRAVSVSVNNYVSGDQKLLQTETDACAPAVTPGQTYRLGIWHKSTPQGALTVFRHTADGWFYWGDLGAVPASPSWVEAAATTPVIPPGTDRIVFGISLSANGTLATDDYSLTQVSETPRPTNELIVNGSLAEGATTPDCFFTAGWGDRAVSQGFDADSPTALPTGSRSYRISVSNLISGDAKLLQSEAPGCAPSVVAGVGYQISVDYKSTSTGNGLTVFKHTTAGWSYWTELDTFPASTEWTTARAPLPLIPSGVDRVAFGLSISSNGTLLTTNYSMTSLATVPPPDSTDPPTTGPAAVGSWRVLDVDMPLRTVHTTLLHDGRLLLIAGSGNDGAQFAAGTFRAVVWSPDTNVYTEVPAPYDMFCAGHVTLSDGKVLIAGGTLAYPQQDQGPNTFKGSNKSYYFDPSDDQFHRLSDMAGAHWYPTLTKLGDGDVWSAGGLDEKAEGTVLTEMFDSSQMKWLPIGQVPQTWSFWGTYPHMYLLDDGMLFYSGGHTFGNGLPGTGAALYDWRTAQIWDLPGLRQKDLRDQAGSVLLPPAQDQKVMIVGGGNSDTNNAATSTVDIIELSKTAPAYQAGPDLPGPGKMYVNLVSLPDRTVLAADGAKYNRSDNVNTAAIYDPEAGLWKSIEGDPIGRNYHSSATLLPDGRVVVLGSNPVDNSFELKISVYSPPYLYKGERPTASGMPTAAQYGDSFPITVTGDVVSASLTAPMSPTHQTDTNARLVDLPIAGTGSSRVVQIPANPNLLPPGPYLLTVLDSNGVPSTADWIWVS